MAINKVVDRNNNVLIDLTSDTITSNKVLAGTKFHGPDGKEYTGTLPANELDSLKYTFIDYDGTLVYSFTDDEIDAMTELPAGPDHTDDNLTFQEWNWTLEALKEWDRTRIDRPIVGANLITTDKKTYLTLDTPITGCLMTIYISSATSTTIDWGDGITETLTSSTLTHTYTEPGIYVISFATVPSSGFTHSYFSLSNSTSLPSNTAGICYIKDIKIGEISLGDYGVRSAFSLEKISIPAKFGNSYIALKSFENCISLKAIVIPNGIGINAYVFNTTSDVLEYVSLPNTARDKSAEYFMTTNALNIVIPYEITLTSSYGYQNCKAKELRFSQSFSETSISQYCFSGCTGITKIKIPEGVKSIGSYCFSGCTNLRSIELPSTLTSIGQYSFSSDKRLSYIKLPDSVTSISNNGFSNWGGTLDLSEQTKVITLSGNPNFSTRKLRILVPLSLLSQYKSASYWSNFAAYMVGV